LRIYIHAINFSIHVGLDTFREKHAELLDQRGISKIYIFAIPGGRVAAGRRVAKHTETQRRTETTTDHHTPVGLGTFREKHAELLDQRIAFLI
jgi:hypothetical protein